MNSTNKKLLRPLSLAKTPGVAEDVSQVGRYRHIAQYPKTFGGDLKRFVRRKTIVRRNSYLDKGRSLAVFTSGGDASGIVWESLSCSILS